MKRLYTLALTGAFALLASIRPVGADEPDSVRVYPPGTGRVYAVEDTIPDGNMQGLSIGEIEVVRKQVPLIEIIRKAREGEKGKYAGLNTLAFNRTLKVIMTHKGKKPKTRCEETVQRLYYRAPDEWTIVTLRDSAWYVGPDGERLEQDSNEKVEMELEAGRQRNLNRLTEIPYYLDDLDEFRFSIANRTLNEKEVLYEVDFEPSSDFSILPGGRIWLLTPNYQIVREEFTMKNRPFPWIIKNIDLLTREWQEIDGRWVEKRITGRVDLGMNFMKVPHTIEFVMNYDQYKFNPELDERIFSGGDR